MKESEEVCQLVPTDIQTGRDAIPRYASFQISLHSFPLCNRSCVSEGQFEIKRGAVGITLYELSISHCEEKLVFEKLSGNVGTGDMKSLHKLPPSSVKVG